jgi:hypothetical protein
MVRRVFANRIDLDAQAYAPLLQFLEGCRGVQS